MKFSIYQMLPRLWGNGKFSSVDDATLEYLKRLGIGYVWYTGMIRHSSGKPFVKGDPGSPYSISDYYDVNPYMADDPDSRMREFELLVERTHAHGMKVILDFVPNHVSPDYSDSHGGIPVHDWCDYDWTDTHKIDYGVPGTWDAMTGIVLYWASKGVDGFRCDMVELVPREFFASMTSAVRSLFPSVIFIGEAYDRGNYRPLLDSGFDYLYDKSGLYDALFAIARGNGTAEAITWNWQFLGPLQERMLNFLENHDEVRFASPAFGGSASLEEAPLQVAALLANAPFMLYFGQEIGIDASESDNCRTSIFNWVKPAALEHLWRFVHGDADALSDEEKRTLRMFSEVLSRASSPSFTSGRMYDLCYCQNPSGGFDKRRHFAFLRGSELVFCDFSRFFGVESGIPRIQIPEEATALR